MNDLATRRHTYLSVLWPELSGHRDTGIPDLRDPPRLSGAYAYRRNHDYTYGLSQAGLRPIGPFPETEEDKAERARAQRRRKHTNKPARIQYVPFRRVHFEPAAIKDEDLPDDVTPYDTMPWWEDEEILVSRNEAMLEELLGSG